MQKVENKWGTMCIYMFMYTLINILKEFWMFNIF